MLTNLARAKLGLCLTAGLLLTGCARGLAPDPEPTVQQLAALQQATEEANAILNKCLVDAAAKLDDGKSDAAAIGFEVEERCSGQFAYVFRTQSRETDPFAQDVYDHDMRPRQIEMATAVVQRLRASHMK